LSLDCEGLALHRVFGLPLDRWVLRRRLAARFLAPAVRVRRSATLNL
jgi:hypothetical protein